MTTSAAIDKRLSKLEAKTRPKRIETLADWVMFIANRKPGEPWPPVDPAIDEAMANLGKKHRNPDNP